ncbi:hypothetical protein ACJJTC_015599 [Scirpophaga incertulas]
MIASNKMTVGLKYLLSAVETREVTLVAIAPQLPQPMRRDDNYRCGPVPFNLIRIRKSIEKSNGASGDVIVVAARRDQWLERGAAPAQRGQSRAAAAQCCPRERPANNPPALTNTLQTIPPAVGRKTRNPITKPCLCPAAWGSSGKVVTKAELKTSRFYVCDGYED